MSTSENQYVSTPQPPLEDVSTPVFYSAIQIANHFIERGINENVKITLIHLLKLTYISHGVHMALRDSKGLFTEQVEAWKYGPVIPSVFFAFRHHVTFNHATFNITIPESPDRYKSIEDAEDIDILNLIWGKYAACTGPQLIEVTHQKGTPWHDIWYKEDGQYRRSAVIPNEKIKAYYHEMLLD